MSDRGLSALAEHAADAARVPLFDDLRDRAARRRRRRRTTTGVGALAGCVVVAVVAVTTLMPGSRTTGPAGHAPSPAPTATSGPSAGVAAPVTPHSPRYLRRHPVAMVNQPDAHIVEVSYADADHATAWWEVCSAGMSDGGCPFVVTWTSDGWATSRARVVRGKFAVYSLADGSAVVWKFEPGSFVIEPDGSTRPITLAPSPTTEAPGGSLVNLASEGGRRPAGMFDARSATVYPPATATQTHCLYDDQWDAAGRVWEYGTARCGPHSGPLTLAWSDDHGGTWSTRTFGKSQILGLAVADHRTAVLLGGLGGSHAVDALDITSDGGSTWQHVRLSRSLPVPLSIATTANGQLFLVSGGALLAANGSWTSLHHVQGLPPYVFQVRAANDVLAVSGGHQSQIDVSTDRGRTWHTVSPRP